MKEIMEHPISSVFHRQFSENQSSTLSSVLSRLESSSYLSIENWKEDVASIWEAAIQTPELGCSAGLAVLNECKRLFSKLCRYVDDSDMASWCSEVEKLTSNQVVLSTSCPTAIRQCISEAPEFREIERTVALEPMSKEELNAFLKASTMITDEVALDEMLQIVNERQSRLAARGKEVWIDATKLKYQTITALKDYMKRILESQGQSYPE